MNDVHFSSKSDEWYKPQKFFEKYNAVYKFDLDVDATKENTKCSNLFVKDDNALLKDWHGNCWCNPQYCNVKEWIRKEYEESLKGVTTVMLIPARTETIGWHAYIFSYAKIEFIKGRIKFGGNKHPEHFPSAVVIFRGDKQYQQNMSLLTQHDIANGVVS